MDSDGLGGGSIFATTQMHNMSHKQGTAPLHGQHEQHRSTRQRDIAARERAYFLWGSSPCLEWRVYTHNASRGHQGGSPGQSALPLGFPGSTGRGPLWCRTGKRHSPCYLQGDKNEDGWNIAPVTQKPQVCYQDLNGPFICFITLAIKQVQTGNKALLSADWIKASVLLRLRPSPRVRLLKWSQTTLLQLKLSLFYELIITCPAVVSRVMCYKKLSMELFIYRRASLRQDAATGRPGAFHYRTPLPWVTADFTLKNR